MNNTQDLSKFGHREKDMAADLLKALANNKWRKGEDSEMLDGVKVEFNPTSGYVFLADDDFNVAMLDDNGELYRFYSCPQCGAEGGNEDYPFSKFGGYCSKECLKKNS